MKKLLTKKNIAKLQKIRKKHKIILCHGVFDVMHLGHITHFRSAKKFGDILIVSLTKSKFIKKGPSRPLFNDTQRLEFLNSIQEVDYTYLCESESAEDAIRKLKPNFYVKGPDYKDNKKDKSKKIYIEKKLIENLGGKIIYTSDKKYSSTKIINNSRYELKTEQREYLNKLVQKYKPLNFLEMIKKLSSKKCLVIGELIFDHYKYGDIIGKAGKEPHLVFRENFEEFYSGGSAAIARHIAPFVKNVNLLTSFGEEKKFKNILKKQFDKNIALKNITKGSLFPTIIKTRYLDINSNYKMFGSYSIPLTINKKFYEYFKREFKKNIINKDLVIICDYGHGLLNKSIIKKINSLKTFSAANSQINSSTTGFSHISKFLNMDLVVINQNELRQEQRDMSTDVKELSLRFLKKNNCKNLIVTSGKDGAILVDRNLKIYKCPAFAIKSLDKVGAGDSVLAMASLALSSNLPKDISLFLSSVAASQSIQTIGNKLSLNYHDFVEDLEFLINV